MFFQYFQGPNGTVIHTETVFHRGRSPVAVWMDVTQTLVIVSMEDHRDVYNPNQLDIHGQGELVEQVKYLSSIYTFFKLRMKI